jgi:hypothetical protein
LDSIVRAERYKDVFSYDSMGNEILQITYEWNKTTNAWINHSKIIYAYENENNKNLATMLFYYDWDNASNDWIALGHNEYIYANNGTITSYIIYRFDNESNNFTERFRFSFMYNSGKTMLHAWDFENNQEEYVQKEEKFDNKGNLTMSITYRWNDEVNDWINDTKFEAAYNKKGNMTIEIHWTDWSSYINDWVTYYKQEYTYENRGSRTIEIRSNWDKETNGWRLYTKTEYEFYPFYSKKDLIIPDIKYVGTNMLTKKIDYKWSGTDWKEGKITTYYWSAKEIKRKGKNTWNQSKKYSE